MKRAALLCPGPALNDFPGREGYDLLIGVNRAACFIELDLWSAFDHYTVVEAMQDEDVPVIGNPTLLTRFCARAKLEKRGAVVLPFDVIDIDATRERHKKTHPERCFNYSATGAAAYAMRVLKVDHLDIWGCTLEGSDDWDGGQTDVTAGHRNPGRWQNERVAWRGLHQMYRKRMVNRAQGQCPQA